MINRHMISVTIDIINTLLFMATVKMEQQPASMLVEEIEQESSLAQTDLPVKQLDKKQLFQSVNIFILMVVLVLLFLGSYYLYSMSSSAEVKNQINENHDKIISFANSGSKGSTKSGSTTKSSDINNDKPNKNSQPANKDVISSNPKIVGSSPGDD